MPSARNLSWDVVLRGRLCQRSAGSPLRDTPMKHAAALAGSVLWEQSISPFLLLLLWAPPSLDLYSPVQPGRVLLPPWGIKSQILPMKWGLDERDPRTDYAFTPPWVFRAHCYGSEREADAGYRIQGRVAAPREGPVTTQCYCRPSSSSQLPEAQGPLGSRGSAGLHRSPSLPETKASSSLRRGLQSA